MTNHEQFKIEELKNNLNKRIERNNIIIEKLKSIEIVTKKDGKPFKNLSQNFTNCKIVKDENSLHYNAINLCIYFMIGYKHDYYKIDLYDYCDELSNDDERKIANNGILRSIYIYNIDEIKSLINSTIENLKKQKESYKMQLKNCDKIAKSYLDKQFKLIEKLENDCGGKNSLYYALRDIYKY